MRGGDLHQLLATLLWTEDDAAALRTSVSRRGAGPVRAVDSATCAHGPWDEQWPTYQYEIARRHTGTTGRTDHFSSDQSHVPLRYLIAVAWPVTATIRGFLAAQGLDQAEVDAMHTPWFKAVTLTVAQWAQPYAPERW